MKKDTLTSEKQALLDIHEQVAQTEEAKRTSISNPDEHRREYASLRNFYIASIILGTSVENLSSEQKDELIGKILRLGDLIIPDLLTLKSDFDVDRAIADVSSVFIKENEIEFRSDDERNEFEEFIGSVVKMWEYHQAYLPNIV